MHNSFKFLLIIIFFVLTNTLLATQTTISSSEPTHYFYTPAPYTNPPFHLVLGFHEISYSLPANLQLQASLMDNIGRINLGAKFGLSDNLSLGAGLAHSIFHVGNGAHGIPSWASGRLGAFLCYGVIKRSSLESAFTLHTQIGDHTSVGVDFGLMTKPSQIWAVIWEVGTSIDLTDNFFYLNTDGGLRINPPSLPFLFFDLGIDLQEFRVHENPHLAPSIYIDVLFAMITK